MGFACDIQRVTISLSSFLYGLKRLYTRHTEQLRTLQCISYTRCSCLAVHPLSPIPLVSPASTVPYCDTGLRVPPSATLACECTERSRHSPHENTCTTYCEVPNKDADEPTHPTYCAACPPTCTRHQVHPLAPRVSNVAGETRLKIHLSMALQSCGAEYSITRFNGA